MTEPRQLSLNAFIYPAGHHEAAWRHPASRPDRIYDVGYYQEIARTAEAATFDAVFFADGPALRTNIAYNAAPGLEPITLLTAIAAATTHLGLIATASTTYYEPYNLARLFSSLDHISGGRAGWNIVTTGTDLAAANFGLDRHPDHTERYARAREFVDAVTQLWDSWEDDAILLDRAGGRYADPDKIHPIDFAGEYLRVRGPFNSARTPRAIRCWYRPGPPTTAVPSPVSTPRRSSPRTSDSAMPRRSTAISSDGRRSSAASRSR